MQYSAVFIITLVSSLYILLKNNINNIASTFLIIGMVTVFFDLLTIPVLTLGIPLLFYISLHQNENLSFKNCFIVFIN